MSRELAYADQVSQSKGPVAFWVAPFHRVQHPASATLRGSALASFLNTTDEFRSANAHRLAEPE